MDEEQVRALFESLLTEQLTPAIQGVLDTLQGHVDGQLSAIKGELVANQVPAPTQEVPEAPTGTVKARLAALEQQLADAQQLITQERDARVKAEQAQLETERARKFDSEFDSVLSQYNIVPETREFLVKALRGDLASAQEVEGKFVTADGKLLSEYLESFMSSPAGQHFLQGQGKVNGLSSVSTQEKPNAQPSQPNMEDVLSVFSF